jgi:protein SCO1/2
MRHIILATLIIFASGCRKTSYPVHGTILEIRHKSNEFLIHHDEIPGFMMAMTMPFKLADSLDIYRFVVGDSLKFRLEMKEEKAFAASFQLLGKGTLPESDNIWDDEYSPLEIGEIFANATFLDLDSHNVSLSDSDGKFRFISYIFTRCPMPNMCPAVIVKNRYLAETFAETGEIEFILISFDYIYDTPSMMKSIYSSHTKSYPNMKFYSSNGHLNDIFMLAGQSFVSFWGVDENDIGHTLRSVLLDPDRRLMKAYDGTEWRTESAERDIWNLLKAYH